MHRLFNSQMYKTRFNLKNVNLVSNKITIKNILIKNLYFV